MKNKSEENESKLELKFYNERKYYAFTNKS